MRNCQPDRVVIGSGFCPTQSKYPIGSPKKKTQNLKSKYIIHDKHSQLTNIESLKHTNNTQQKNHHTYAHRQEKAIEHSLICCRNRHPTSHLQSAAGTDTQQAICCRDLLQCCSNLAFCCYKLCRDLLPSAAVAVDLLLQG